MMNENNNMDNKLRQLENQSLPDLSRRDEHWQEMKKMLQPNVAIQNQKPGNRIKMWHWIVAACFIGGMCFLVFDRTNDTNTTKPKQNIAVITDTTRKEIIIVPSKISSPAIIVNDQVALPPVNSKKEKRKPAKKEPVEKITDSNIEMVRVLPPDTLSATDPIRSKTVLANFFNQLEKASQEFVIDNKRDTVIWGKDGTALLIPANIFYTNEKVTIKLTEYYSYEDIITNKLSTSSDGAQLVTGGMIHLEATSNNKKVDMLPQKSIRWFLPDTSAEMADMQMFTGSEENTTNAPVEGMHDTLTTAAYNSSINWRLSSNSFSHNFITRKVKVVDLRDYPFKITSGKKYKGYFFINNSSYLSKDELREMLHKKYPYYDKIIIAGKRKKKEWDPTWLITYDQYRSDTYYSIGDTTWVYPFEAKAYKLQVLDTLVYTNRSSTTGSPTGLNNQLKKVADKYSVDINSLGWKNCDRFYRDSRSKVDYVVNIGEPSSEYYTFLVFDRIKSMMSGLTAGNKVVFPGVPEGETAKVISIGVKDGKPVSAMEKVIISRSTLAGLRFEETTPSQFKEQAATMDK